MRGSVYQLSEIIEGQRKHLIIPVYQRNYDWKIENCNHLLEDLARLHQSERQKHFFGSIVTSLADDYGHNRLVIDGQQRLTTISLLLLAAIKAVKEGKLQIDNPSSVEDAKDLFIYSKISSDGRTIKLTPIENDRIAYDKIVNEESALVENSNITRNFDHFYRKLTQEECPIRTFDALLSAIDKLQIISIELGKDDDAQLIFESLNSTGLALTEADKIRNYLLMSLAAEEQEECFKNYWQKIEEATDSEPTMFFRDYLTIKQSLSQHVRLSSLYFEWKKYMANRDRKEEMKEMTKYAKYYQQVTKAQFASKDLSKQMQHICNIETDVPNVFFIQFLDYAEAEQLSNEEIRKVIALIENFVARRIMCNLPTNALSKVCCALHKDVLKSIEEYKKADKQLDFSYADILAYHILRREGNSQIPRDEQFLEDIKKRDAYHMPTSYKTFFFERLENAVPGEYNDVAKEMADSDVTIEHIMPQTLSREWCTMLGDNYEEIHKRYLHTFANLTLTGINSKLSNKPFAIKRDGDGENDKQGYAKSKYRLTRSVTYCEQWTEEELKARAEEIAQTLLQLYPWPATDFKPLPKPVDEVEFNDSFNPRFRTIKGFILFDEKISCTNWKEFLTIVIDMVAQRYQDEIDELYADKNCKYLMLEADLIGEQKKQYYREVSHGRYVLTNIDSTTKIKYLRDFFEHCGIAEEELTFLLEPLKANDTPEEQE